MRIVRTVTPVEMRQFERRRIVKRVGNIIARFTVIPDLPIQSVQSSRIELDISLRVDGVEIPYSVFMEDIYLEAPLG